MLEISICLQSPGSTRCLPPDWRIALNVRDYEHEHISHQPLRNTRQSFVKHEDTKTLSSESAQEDVNSRE